MKTHNIMDKGLKLVGIRQYYGKNLVINDVELYVQDGEFITLLGPSGSGKTTLLMIIAGFVQPSHGQIELNGKSILYLPPEKRNFGIVFQGYALFPHLNVFENVAFPLRTRKIDENIIKKRVMNTLDMVQLVQLETRLPKQLSGGQQQRVALARALIFEPSLLLLDEPLGALDKKLREELQIELRILHKRLGSTFISVTHDQEEALSLSDRVAVINDGKIEQVGPPEELYEKPRNLFVADFLGKSNLFEGEIIDIKGNLARVKVDEEIKCTVHLDRGSEIGEKLQFMIRPERIKTNSEEPETENRFRGRILTNNYFGDTSRYLIEMADGKKVKVRNETPYKRQFKEDDKVWISWDPDGCVLL